MEQKEEPITKGGVILELAIEYTLGNDYPSDLLKLDHSITQSTGSKLVLAYLITEHSQSIFESLKSLPHNCCME